MIPKVYRTTMSNTAGMTRMNHLGIKVDATRGFFKAKDAGDSVNMMNSDPRIE